MSESLTATTAVSLDDLCEALEFTSFGADLGSTAYLSRQTGKVYCVSDYVDPDDPLPDDLDTSDDYILIPTKRDLRLGAPLVFSFIEADKPELWDKVSEIFSRKGAYSRFKNLLIDQGILEKWYAFEEQATKQALRDWCEQEGIACREP